MSDPSTLLLSVCVACNQGADRSISLELPSCRQLGSPNPLKDNVPKCISLPEAIAIAPGVDSPFIRAIAPPSQSASRPGPEGVGGDRNPSPSSAIASLRPGSRGELVEELQIRLRRLGYYSVAIDGIYGPLTHAAVLKFQQTGEPTTHDLISPPVWIGWQQGEVANHSASSDSMANSQSANSQDDNSSIAKGSAANSSIQAIQRELQEAIDQKREVFSQEPLIAPDASTSNQEQRDRATSSPANAASANPVKQRVVWQPFSAAPSSTTFYFWLVAWVVVYIGGFVVIFLTSDSQLRERWLSKQRKQHKTITPQTINKLQDDELQDERQPNELQAIAVDGAVDPGHLPQQPAIPLLETIPNPPHLPRDPGSDTKIVDRADLESPEEEVPVLWADEVLPALPRALVDIASLFDELKAELHEEATHEAVEPLPQPSQENTHTLHERINETATPSTILGILSAAESNSEITYTYVLLDDAEGRFLLRDNELRIRDDVLHAIQEDTKFVVNVRRTDSDGKQLDESFTLHLGMPDRAEADEDAEQLAPIA